MLPSGWRTAMFLSGRDRGPSIFTDVRTIGSVDSKRSMSAHWSFTRLFVASRRVMTWRVSPTLSPGTAHDSVLSSGSYMFIDEAELSVASLSVFAKSTARALPSAPMISTRTISPFPYRSE